MSRAKIILDSEFPETFFWEFWKSQGPKVPPPTKIETLLRSMIPATGSRKILQKRFGKVTGSCKKTPEVAGTWKQYSGRKLSGFFPVDSCQLPVLSGRNQPKISEKNPAGILLPQNHRNYPEPAVSGPGCSTWVLYRAKIFFCVN